MKATVEHKPVKALRSTTKCKLTHEQMKKFAARLSKDPDAARDFLQRAGIVTRTGKVAKAYGG